MRLADVAMGKTTCATWMLNLQCSHGSMAFQADQQSHGATGNDPPCHCRLRSTQCQYCWGDVMFANAVSIIMSTPQHTKETPGMTLAYAVRRTSATRTPRMNTSKNVQSR